jgi:RNA polymerase sigma factor (sigma-70 family)
MENAEADLDATDWLTQTETEIRRALRPIAYKISGIRGTGAEETLIDLYVEVTRRLLERSDIYTPNRPPLGWILGTAQKVALRWRDEVLLARKRQGELSEGMEIGDKGVAAEKMLQSVEAEQILSTLLPEDRQLVKLYVMENLPAEEVSMAVGISAVNVRVRCHRLMKTLRAQQAEERS